MLHTLHYRPRETRNLTDAVDYEPSPLNALLLSPEPRPQYGIAKARKWFDMTLCAEPFPGAPSLSLVAKGTNSICPCLLMAPLRPLVNHLIHLPGWPILAGRPRCARLLPIRFRCKRAPRRQPKEQRSPRKSPSVSLSVPSDLWTRYLTGPALQTWLAPPRAPKGMFRLHPLTLGGSAT